MMPPAYFAAAVSREVADPHQAGDAVARDIVAGDRDRARIDIAGRYLAPQQLGRGDRQDSGPGADIQRMGYPALLRQCLQGQQTTAGRGMLAGAEGGRRIERDADRPRRHPAAMMRAIDKEPADPQRRKSELVFREPVAIRQFLLADLDEFSSTRRSGKREPRRQVRGQNRRLRVGFEAPFLGCGLEGRHGCGDIVEERKDRTRRCGPADPGVDMTDAGAHQAQVSNGATSRSCSRRQVIGAR